MPNRICSAAMTVLTAAALSMPISFQASAAAPATYVYVSNNISNDVNVFRLDQASGVLSAVQTVPAGGTAVPMALSVSTRRLYVGVRTVPFHIANFAIDPHDGKLSALGDAPLSDSMAYLALDQTGRYLFSASYGGAKFSVNPVGENGIAGAPLQNLPTGPMAHSILPSPDNRYVFGAVLGADVWLRYNFDAATGQLTGQSTALALPPQSGPRFFAWSPDQRFVYLTDELDGKLRVLAFDGAHNTVRLIQTVSLLPDGFAGKPWGADVHVTADGRYVYTSERSSSTLSGYRIDQQSGMVTRIGVWPTETQPRGFNIASSGRYLLAVGEKSGHLSVYRIDADGSLHSTGRYRTGDGPNWIALGDFN
jgi:6-phosphogluconolactonase